MHLIYLDEQRTHELHAEINPVQDGLAFVTTEFPLGSKDPLEALQLEERLPSTEELLARLADLEARLAATGTYWRADAADMAWARVQPATPPALDLRAHEFDLPDRSGRIRFHHFHGQERDRLVVSLPRPDAGERFILADLAFEFPRIDAADVNILHTRLAPTLLQSTLAREHIELPRKGFRKLVEPAQYQEAYGEGWQDAARRTFQKAATLLLGRRDGPIVKDAPRDATEVTRELEQALASPAVRAARARFLDADAQAELLRGGEFAIRRYVNQKRRRADHHDQWRLSLLEAALLVEWATQAGRQSLIEEQAGKLIRHARAAR